SWCGSSATCAPARRRRLPGSASCSGGSRTTSRCSPWSRRPSGFGPTVDRIARLFVSERLGKYRVIQLLATGGMGEVLLARHEGPAGFAKTVVVKKILRHLAHDQSFIDMFLNEARLAAQLTHPNIVQIFELGQEEDTWFIAMEYVHGRSLRVIKQQLLERKEVMAPWVAARLCSQALQGLHYAHTLTDERGKSLGVIHRDVSPDNVLVTFGGVVKLVDFGIAKPMNAESTTRTGTL